MPSTVIHRLFVAALLGFGAATAAEAQICVSGQANAYAATGQGQAYLTDSRTIGDAYACQPGAVFSGAVAATQRNDLYLGLQSSDASLFAYAMYGGLRGSAYAQSSIGDTYNNNITGASAQMTEAWNDRITFHTANPLGADVTFAMTLDDGFGTTLSPAYVRNSAASITAISYFFFNGSPPLLSVIDSQSLYVPTSGPATPILATNLAGQHTVSTVMHVYDGETALIAQSLYLSAGVEANGTAFADAAHTAYFNLWAADETTTYTTASGTMFATAGSPFTTVAPVPEPSEWALMAGGLGLLGFVGHRRRPAA